MSATATRLLIMNIDGTAVVPPSPGGIDKWEDMTTTKWEDETTTNWEAIKP